MGTLSRFLSPPQFNASQVEGHHGGVISAYAFHIAAVLVSIPPDAIYRVVVMTKQEMVLPRDFFQFRKHLLRFGSTPRGRVWAGAGKHSACQHHDCYHHSYIFHHGLLFFLDSDIGKTMICVPVRVGLHNPEEIVPSGIDSIGSHFRQLQPNGTPVAISIKLPLAEGFQA